MSVTEITIKKSSSLRYYLTLANVNGTRAARLFELHLHCCILRYRCAPHNAAICILFQEDAEAREHRPGIPLVTDWSQAPFLITLITGIIFSWLFTTSFSFPHRASQIAYCCSAGFRHYDTPASSNLPPLQFCDL